MLDSSPIDTYEQAVFRLVQQLVSDEFEPASLDFGIELVADIYWHTPLRVRRDVMAEAAKLGYHPSQRLRFVTSRQAFS